MKQSSHEVWETIREAYVSGKYHTARQLAEHFDRGAGAIRRQMAKEGWVKQRTAYIGKETSKALIRKSKPGQVITVQTLDTLIEFESSVTLIMKKCLNKMINTDAGLLLFQDKGDVGAIKNVSDLGKLLEIILRLKSLALHQPTSISASVNVHMKDTGKKGSEADVNKVVKRAREIMEAKVGPERKTVSARKR